MLNHCDSTPRWLLICFGLWLSLVQSSFAQAPRLGTTWEVLASQTRIAGQPLIWNRHQSSLARSRWSTAKHSNAGYQ